MAFLPEDIFHFKPAEAKRKQPNNPFSLDEKLPDGSSYDRVKNHIILGQLVDFVPQLVIPDDVLLHESKAKGELTLQKIHGQTILEMAKAGELTPGQITLACLLSLDQIEFLYQRFGILLTDRTTRNAMLAPIENEVTNDNPAITLNDQSFQLWQIDLEKILDVGGKPDRLHHIDQVRQFDHQANTYNLAKTDLHMALLDFLSGYQDAMMAATNDALKPAERIQMQKMLYEDRGTKDFEMVENQLIKILNEIIIPKL